MLLSYPLTNMAINVEINKNKNENNMSVIKRFTRRVQESGVLPKVRSNRWLLRKPSAFRRKNDKLTRIERKEKIMEQIKLGKMPETGRRRR